MTHAGAPSLDRRILALAVPAAASAMLHVVHRLVDMMFLSRVGQKAVAALSVSSVMVWMLSAIAAMVGVGLTALVARYVGAGRARPAGYIASQGLGVSILLGLASAAIGWVVTPWIMGATSRDLEVAADGAAYTRIFWGGATFVLLQQAGDAVFRGHGNTRTPFAIALVCLLLNIVLDAVMIFGWGPIPALGVAGAAWATLIATLVGAALVWGALHRAGHIQRGRPDDDELRLAEDTRIGEPGLFGLDRAVLLRITRVGFPIAIAGFFFNVIYLGLYAIVERAGGAPAQAGLGLGHTGEGVAFVLCLGWSAAASALVGQHLGAGQPEEAERAAWRSVLQCGSLCFLWGLFLLLASEDVAGFVLRFQEGGDQALDYGASYFRIVALVLAPQAVEIVLEGAFGGAGMTLPPMIVSATFSLLRIPLAIFAAFGLGWGVEGVWWTISITALIRGLIIGIWFSRGTWKTRTV